MPFVANLNPKIILSFSLVWSRNLSARSTNQKYIASVNNNKEQHNTATGMFCSSQRKIPPKMIPLDFYPVEPFFQQQHVLLLQVFLSFCTFLATAAAWRFPNIPHLLVTKGNYCTTYWLRYGRSNEEHWRIVDIFNWFLGGNIFGTFPRYNWMSF